MVISWSVIVPFLGGNIAGDFIYIFGIRLSGGTLAPVIEKRETLVGILDTNKIYCGANVSNLITRVVIWVNFCVLVYSLFVLYISALGATKPSFDFSILSIGVTE